MKKTSAISKLADKYIESEYVAWYLPHSLRKYCKACHMEWICFSEDDIDSLEHIKTSHSELLVMDVLQK